MLLVGRRAARRHSRVLGSARSPRTGRRPERRTLRPCADRLRPPLSGRRPGQPARREAPGQPARAGGGRGGRRGASMWEYTIREFVQEWGDPGEGRAAAAFLGELNELGRQGWEAVGLAPRTHYDRGGGPPGWD